MDKFFEQIEKFISFFKKDSVLFAAIISFSIYLFNYFRRREDATVKAGIEAHEKRMEAHERRMAEQMSFVEQEIAGLNNNIIFNNMQNLEMVREIKAMQDVTARNRRYYRRKK